MALRRTQAMAMTAGVSAIALVLKVKRTPQLAFEYDPWVELGVRMTLLFDDLVPDPADDEPDAD